MSNLSIVAPVVIDTAARNLLRHFINPQSMSLEAQSVNIRAVVVMYRTQQNASVTVLALVFKFLVEIEHGQPGHLL